MSATQVEHTHRLPPSDSRYKKGCRCDECRKAHSEYTRARRAKALADGLLTHGRRAAYDAGCRCDHCRDARVVAYFTVPSERQPKRRRPTARREATA